MQHLCPPLSWIILNHDKSKSNDLFISVTGSLVYIYGTMGQEIYYNNRQLITLFILFKQRSFWSIS